MPKNIAPYFRKASVLWKFLVLGDTTCENKVLKLLLGWAWSWGTCGILTCFRLPHDQTETESVIFCILVCFHYNFDPLKPPRVYCKNWGLQGYTLFFLFLLKNIDCRYSLEPPRRGGSNEYPQSMFWAEIWKMLDFFPENFQFLEAIFSIYLNRRVFVMVFPKNPISEYCDSSSCRLVQVVTLRQVPR